MEKFITLTATCVPINRSNVDTDQIIPARFLKVTSKAGLGENVFRDLRYAQDGAPITGFPLNQPQYAGAQILVAPQNFGCGSSREHAPWALKDYGIRAMLAVSFADIFRNNSLKNGLLPVELPEPVIMRLLADIEAGPTLTVTIDLENQCVTLPGQPVQVFEIDAYRKTCLMEGLDDVGYTLGHENDIASYEAAHA